MSTRLEILKNLEQGKKATKLETEQYDYFNTAKDNYNKFNEQSWRKGMGYLLPSGHFPLFNEKMEGLESGLFLFAGESNVGKSNLLFELILQYASNPDNKLVGLYFSLDDTNDKIIPRILASHAQLLGSQEQGIPISVFSKPTRYLERLRQIDLDSDEAYILYSYLYDDISAGGTLIPENLNEDPDTFETSVRYRAYSWLKETSNYFHLVDGTTISNGEQLIEFCHNFKSYVQSINNNPDINLIVGIDSFSDIIWVEKHFNSDKELNDYTAQRMKALAVEELKCPIFGTIHLRKVDQKKRPNIADVKESGRWAYEASLVFLLHNDVSRNGEAATIFSTTDDSDFKLPIIEILWAKNKQSSFKGRTYCYFKTEFSRVWECSKEATERFNALLYSL